MPRQVISADEAEDAVTQHTRPCGDCPWCRDSAPGWLGRLSSSEWIDAAHGEATIECHTLLGAQCAGAAIYRANTFKSPRNPDALRLPADRERVFAAPAEFTTHHQRRR